MGIRNVVFNIALGLVVWSGQVNAQSGATETKSVDSARDSRAEPMDKSRCYAEYENSQLSRQAGRLRDARASLLLCSSNACPSLVQTDCITWLDQVNRSISTVVFAARVGNRDEFSARVLMDGQVVQSALDGKAVAIDPGPHQFRFERPPYPAVELKVLVSEGEKGRLISAVFDSGEEPTSAATLSPVGLTSAVPAYRPVPTLFYVLGGVALVGAGGFAYFGLAGKSQRSDLLESCAPFCSDSDIGPVKTKFLIADISLGVGVLSAAAATWLYLARPAVPSGTEQQHSALSNLVISPTEKGAAVSYRGGF